MREALIQTSFNAGEISPRLYGRTDFKKYGSAVAKLSNIIGLVSGPAVFRPGTVFISSNYNAAKKSRLIPFKYSTTQAYMLEFYEGKIRFFRNRGLILSSAAVTNGTFTGSIAGWTTIVGGTGVAAYGSNDATINGGAAGSAAIYQTLSYIGAEQYTVTADVSGGTVNVFVESFPEGADIFSGTMTAGTGRTINFTTTSRDSAIIRFENSANVTIRIDNVSISSPAYSITSPYQEADLEAISYAQDADVLYLAFPSSTILPKTLQRYGHAQWKLQDMDFTDGPYLDTNTSTTTITSSGTTGTVTFTASTAIFAATDVGRHIRYRHNNTAAWGWGTVSTYTSPTVVSVAVRSTLSGTTASTEWRLGAFSQTTGYPALVTFHEFRLIYANTTSKPNFVWMSESQGYGQNKALFAPSAISGTVSDSHSIYFPLSAGDVSNIFWMSSGNILAIGTADSEWVVESGDTSKALSPTNTRANRRTNHGSTQNVNAVRIDGTVMFSQGTGTKVNRFVFNYAKDQYDAVNLSQLAEHLFDQKTITRMTYCSEPFQIVWCMMSDGTLNALTFVDSEEVGGWSYHEMGGAFGSGSPVVESIASIPSQDSSYNELWMVVKRTVNGSTVRYIEVMEKPFFRGDRALACNLDCSLTYNGAAVTTISGLSHLEGQTVTILANGANHPTRTVSGGQITLTVASSKVVVGLPYDGDFETLDFDSTNAFQGTSMGQIRRITEVAVRLFETGLLYGARADQSDDKLTVMEPRSSADLMDMAPALKTEIRKVQIESQWDLSSRLRLQFRSPEPGTLCSIMFKAKVNEG